MEITKPFGWIPLEKYEYALSVLQVHFRRLWNDRMTANAYTRLCIRQNIQCQREVKRIIEGGGFDATL